jgi:hypothetical protein
VEHPHRESKAAAEAKPPSQGGASSEGRPRTTGSFQFKTRPIPPEAESVVDVADPERLPLPSKLPVIPVSVQAAKSIFESKISPNRLAPHTEPSKATAVVKGTSTKKTSQVKQPPLPSHDEPTHVTCLTAPYAPNRKESDPALPIPRPPPQAPTRVASPQRTNPFSRPKSEAARLNVVVTKPTERQDLSILEDALPTSDIGSEESEPVTQRSSTNISDFPPRHVKPPGLEDLATEDGSRVDEVSKASLPLAERASYSDQSKTWKKL